MYHQVVRRLSLQLEPTRLSFCAAEVGACAPNAGRIPVHSDGRSRPLMRVETTGPAKAQRRRFRESPSETARSTTQVIELYRGLSSDIALPTGFELIVHEILGNIASAEGAIHAINELRARQGLTRRTCRVLPLGASTMLAPTMALTPSIVERLLSFEKTGRWSAQPRSLYAMRGFPFDHFLATPQPLERLDFNQRLPHVNTRTCTFTTCRAGFFDGLHMHLVVDVDESNVIDVYRERTTWTCSYVRLFGATDAIWLPAGSTIECVCTVDASTMLPTYDITVSVSCGQGPLREVANFCWRGDG